MLLQVKQSRAIKNLYLHLFCVVAELFFVLIDMYPQKHIHTVM